MQLTISLRLQCTDNINIRDGLVSKIVVVLSGRGSTSMQIIEKQQRGAASG